MAVKEKISKGLKSATTHLEHSILALNKKDENSFADSLWHVAAELEYTLFLFSITSQNKKDLSKWKPNSEPKIETSSMVMNAQNLLNEAEKFVVNEKLLDAYKSAYVARHYVLKVQEDLARKKRKVLRKKQ
jgi:hypothetical protein